MTAATELPHIPVQRLQGDEPFKFKGQPVGPSVLEFWQWAFSELAGNTMRGTVAEFIVATAAGIEKGVQIPWDACDLRLPGGITLEVKTTGYLQTWSQKKLARPSWSIAKSKAWDPQSNTYSPEPRRNSEVYVFCLHHHTDKSTINPLELEQWTFFVVTRADIEARFDSLGKIGMPELQAMEVVGVDFQGLKVALAKLQGTGQL